MTYSCFVISNRPDLFPAIEQSVSPEKVTFFDGTGYESFSKLVNHAVVAAPTETVVLMSDRVLPTQQDIQKIVRLLDKGYGFVGLYRLALFGFKKELFRTIGVMDELYVGGGYEDHDLYFRLREANIPVYITEEAHYTPGPTRWTYMSDKRSHARAYSKWDMANRRHHGMARRLIPEAPHQYDLGPRVPMTLLPISENFVTAGGTNSYFQPTKQHMYRTSI